MSPILQYEETTFAYIKYNNLYIVAMTRTNANVALIFVYLYRMIQVHNCVEKNIFIYQVFALIGSLLIYYAQWLNMYNQHNPGHSTNLIQ